MKQQTIIKLAGTFLNNEGRHVVKTQQANLVSEFVGASQDNQEYFIVTLDENEKSGVIFLTTPKGKYILHWNPAGYYGAVIDNIKVHVVLKKISGKLIYWA